MPTNPKLCPAKIWPTTKVAALIEAYFSRRKSSTKQFQPWYSSYLAHQKCTEKIPKNFVSLEKSIFFVKKWGRNVKRYNKYISAYHSSLVYQFLKLSIEWSSNLFTTTLIAMKFKIDRNYSEIKQNASLIGRCVFFLSFYLFIISRLNSFTQFTLNRFIIIFKETKK